MFSHMLSDDMILFFVIVRLLQIEQKLEKMAFVFRNEHDCYPKSHTPGPSYYQPQPNISPPKPLPVPFNQSSPRKIWQQNNIPGPGAYDAAIATENGKLLVQQNGKLFLMNTKTESCNFKSACQRFKVIENMLPGPGQYQTKITHSNNQTSKKQRLQSASNKSNLQKYLLMTHNHKVQENNVKLQIILDKQTNTTNQAKCQKLDLQKKSVPFNSSVERTIRNRPQTSIGPGSYNVPNYQKQKEHHARIKPTYSIAKFKKVIITQEEDRQWVKNEENVCHSKQQNKEMERCSSSNGIRRNKDEFFGSTVARFINTETTCLPGPGSYDVTQRDSKPVKKQKIKLAFGRLSTPEKFQFHTLVSPFIDSSQFSRKIQPTFIQKQKNWNFGSNEPRFKEKSNQASGKIGQYQSLNMFIGGKHKLSANKENDKLKFKLKKKHSNNCKRQTLDKNEKDQRPLCYAAQVNTISKKVGQKQQVNAPFTSQATRFADIDKDMNIIDELLCQSEKNVVKQNRRLQKKLQPRGLMDSNNPRFNYKDPVQNISPCSYDPTKPAKKEFNKLFL